MNNTIGAGIFAAVLLISVFAIFTVQSKDAEQGPTTGSAVALFAGGCFWCMEPPYDKVDGVISTISGYTDGHKENPSYKEVSSGQTGHTEAIQITYDPNKVSYEKLLEIFWRNIDPTTPDRQFCDGGTQYRSGIYYLDAEQQQLAEQSKTTIEQSGVLKKPIVTEIKPATTFYPAEEYHQDYYLKNPVRYKFYRYNCGRDQKLADIWG
ncbi:MAG: peptide-methionine (S)-S-oxide reductase MsrA [Pseudomonadota bacterium]